MARPCFEDIFVSFLHVGGCISGIMPSGIDILYVTNTFEIWKEMLIALWTPPTVLAKECFPQRRKTLYAIIIQVYCKYNVVCSLCLFIHLCNATLWILKSIMVMQVSNIYVCILSQNIPSIFKCVDYASFILWYSDEIARMFKMILIIDWFTFSKK